MVIHDIRRSVATRMADLGVQPHVIDANLQPPGGPKRGGWYLQPVSYEREMKAALAVWEDHIRTLVEGDERKVLAFATPTP